jgi:DNA-directed RNA polymerase specialized sigma24 family protein
MTTSNKNLLERESKATTSGYTPDSFEDMFLKYYAYVVDFVHSLGIDRKDTEDVAMSILTRFYERESFDYYSPDHKGSQEKVAAFRTFLSGFVKMYVRHYRDLQGEQKDRVPYSIDKLMFEDTTYAEHPSNAVEDSHLALLTEELFARISAHLKTLPPLRKVNLSDFFDAVTTQVKAEGVINRPQLARDFGVTTQTIMNWLKLLRVHVEHVIKED